MRLPPLPLLTLAFAAGIAWSGTRLTALLPLAGVAVGAAVAAVWFLRAAPRWALPALCILALATGAAWEAYDRAQHPDVLAPWIEQRVEVEGRVLDEPRRTATGRWAHRIETERLRRPEGEWPLRARLLLNADYRLAPGEQVRAAGFLRRIVGTANFGTFDAGRYYARQHCYAALHCQAPFVARIGPARLRLDRQLALGLRDRMMAVHQRSLPPEHAALLNSLVFGSRAVPVDATVERDFRRAGVIHVLVASGAQVMLLVGLVVFLRRWLPFPAWVGVCFALASAWGYGLMAGGGPSIVRAGVMAVALAVAHALGREPHPLSLLALAALALLCLDPGLLFDLGFQLSVAAVWGLLVLAPWLSKVLPARPRWLWLLVSASLAAQIATAPLVAYHFCQVAPAGVVANLLAVPLAGLLLVGGLATSLLGLAWPYGAYLADSANLVLLVLLRWGVRGCAQLPGGHWWVVPPSAVGVTLGYLLLALLPRLRRDHLTLLAQSRALPGVVAGTLVLLLGWRLIPRPAVLRVTFLDVGQGDSILVQAPSGRALLVDGGGAASAGFDFGERVLLPALLKRGARRLACVLLTHPQADHCGGLPAVCRELPVGALIDPALPATCPEAHALHDWVVRRRIPHLRARAGTSWLLDSSTRLTLLHPPEPRLAGTGDDDNNNAVVLRVDFGRTAFLLTGDIEAEAEEHLRQSGLLAPVTVLKVAHHGSRSSTGAGFLGQVRPQVAVISVGRANPYGHPTPVVLRRLAAQGIAVYRTDEVGAVEVVSDGATITLRTARGQSGLPRPGAGP